jgi:hypothetical protein
MSRVLRAYLWAIWTRDRRWILLGSIATVAMIVAAPILARSNTDIHLIKMIIETSYAVINGILLMIFAPARDIRKNHTEFRSLPFNLPVTTVDLVASPLLIGSFVTVICWITTALLICRPVGIEVPVVIPAATSAALLITIQSVFRAPTQNYYYLKSIIIYIHLFLIIIYVLLLDIIIFINNSFWYRIELLIPISAIYCFGFAKTLLSVIDARRGTIKYPAPSSRAMRSFLRSEREGPTSFTSKNQAQFWRERTSNRFNIRFYTFNCIWIFLSIVTRFAGHGNGHYQLAIDVLLLVLCFWFIQIMFSPLYGIESDRGDRGEGVSTFIEVRPITDGSIVALKFLTAASHCFGMILYLLLLIILLTILQYKNFLPSLSQIVVGYRSLNGDWRFVLIPGSILILLCLSLKYSTECVAAGILSRRNTSICIAMWAPLMYWNYALLAFIVIIFIDPKQTSTIQSISRIFALVSLAKCLVAFLSYRSALKLRLIGARTLILGFASWTGLTACGFMLYRIVFEGRSPPIHPIVALMGIASLVPLCRYSLAPLAMYWVRHR